MTQVWGKCGVAAGSVYVKELAGKGVHQWIPLLGYCFKEDLPGMTQRPAYVSC